MRPDITDFAPCHLTKRALMHYPSLSALTADLQRSPPQGPVALILIEGDVAVAQTISHHANAGFARIVTFCAPEQFCPPICLTPLTVWISTSAQRMPCR